MAKFADHMDKITEGVTAGYKKIESGAVKGFGKVTKEARIMSSNDQEFLVQKIRTCEGGRRV